ncbi:MAG TPA: 30S ribosomal protein S6 [Candidatus Deferrimicrobium sp.]|nr:30S ribosomal protein S6 [Candidatus Deferrimicrobium sp.]
MNLYEVLYILKPELDEETTSTTIEKFSTLINNNGGEVVSVDKWGKRRLAYEIDDRREGIYTLVNFNGVGATAKELERVFKITDGVLRYLITRKED